MLNGKVAVVTGGASKRGIGQAIAATFAEHGARVAILDVDGLGAEQAARALGPENRGYVCDVTKRKDIETAFSKLANELGTPSILVNNSGITQPKRLNEIADSDYDAVLDVNLRGSFLCSQIAMPYIRNAGEGSIVCISSVSAQRGGGVFGGPHYSAAKAGILGLVRALARDLASEGIRVNALAPGFIDTDITKGKLSEQKKAEVAASIPIKRAGQPEEVASACLFLASSMASYITGEVLDVNGGLHID